MRWVIAALVVVGLAVGVVLAWPSGTEEPPDTFADATTTTSTSLPADTTTSAAGAATTTVDEGSHVVETVEEAEEILRGFLLGWFLAIYEQDESTLQSLVANPRQIEAGIAQFGVMEFETEPTPDGIVVEDLEVLRSDEDCLATWSDSGAIFRGGTSEAVHVFRWYEGAWLFVNTWVFRDDLWEADCESTLQP